MRISPFAKSTVALIGFMCLLGPGLNHAQSSPPQVKLSAKTASPGNSADSILEDFNGLTYTAEQTEAISKIRADSAARMEAVSKDDKLTADQKDAMLAGYTRIEAGWIYKVLTPEQKREVRLRFQAHRAAEQPAQNKRPSPPR
jgi:hypothetical protein